MDLAIARHLVPVTGHHVANTVIVVTRAFGLNTKCAVYCADDGEYYDRFFELSGLDIRPLSST